MSKLEKALEREVARDKADHKAGIAERQAQRRRERDHATWLKSLHRAVVRGVDFSGLGGRVGTAGNSALNRALADAAGVVLADGGFFYITSHDRMDGRVSFEAEILEGVTPEEYYREPEPEETEDTEPEPEATEPEPEETEGTEPEDDDLSFLDDTPEIGPENL